MRRKKKMSSTGCVHQLQNNTYYVMTKAGAVLVNSPPETLKFLLARELEVPQIILLPPDVPVGDKLGSSGFIHQGINYASVEFLLYANYYFGNEQKTTIITVTSNQATRIKRVLQETIIGPLETSEYYPNPWIQRECRAMSSQNTIGRPVQLDDMVHVTSLEDGGGNLDNGVFIQHNGENLIFNEDGEDVAVISTIIDEPAMPLMLAPPRPVQRQELTLQFVGGSDGFDPEGITTCFLAYFGSAGQDGATLFDVAAYLRVRLGNLGISPHQISEVVISHLHEDHIAGLPELLLMGECRVRLITSDIIYHSLLRVMSALLDVTETEVAILFDYYPLNPGQPLVLNGKKFEAIYAIHTIPTIAIRVNGLCYSGDMRYDEEWFEALMTKNILNSTRKTELTNFADGALILVHDAGGGVVHTTVTSQVLDSLAAKSKHLVLTHARKINHQLPQTHKNFQNIEFAGDGHITSIGKILQNVNRADKVETISACPLYARLTIAERVALAQNLRLTNWGPIQTILQQGEKSNGTAYIVHKGLVEKWVNGKRSQISGRGTSIGERGALINQQRSTTVIAHSAVQLLELEVDVFQSIADRLGLLAAFERVERLWQHPIFKSLPWATLLDLALDFQQLFLPTGRLLFEYGRPGHECYLLMSGAITLFNRNLSPIGTFTRSGEFFGGRAVLFGVPRNTSACVAQESEIWALPAPALKRLQMIYPNVILHLRSVEAKHHGLPPFISVLDTV